MIKVLLKYSNKDNRDKIINLKYSNKDKRDKIINLISSISHYFKNQPNSSIYKVSNYDEFSMLYVYLMFFLSKDEEFIIKVGYSGSKNHIKLYFNTV